MSGEPTIPATKAGRALIEATARWANARTRAVYPGGDAPLAVPHWSDVDAFGREVLEPAILAIEAEARAEPAAPDTRALESALNRLVWCAVRYGLGRRTYVTADIAESVARIKDHLRDDTKRIIVTDIDRAEREEGLGDSVDEGAWKGLRAALSERGQSS